MKGVSIMLNWFINNPVQRWLFESHLTFNILGSQIHLDNADVVGCILVVILGLFLYWRRRKNSNVDDYY